MPFLEYVVRSHTTGQLTPAIPGDSTSQLVSVALDVRGYEILCAYPLAHYELGGLGGVNVSNLGLVGKMTGCAAIVSSSFTLQPNGRICLETSLKALGVLGRSAPRYLRKPIRLLQVIAPGLYISRLPELTVRDNFLVIVQGQVIPPHTVSVSKRDPHVVEVDVERAWDEMKLQPGWSNEVVVKVYFGLDS